MSAFKHYLLSSAAMRFRFPIKWIDGVATAWSAFALPPAMTRDDLHVAQMQLKIMALTWDAVHV